MIHVMRRVLVTGGTGSFGRAFVRKALASPAVERLVVYSRDELKQSEMAAEFGNDERLRFFIGDVRDRDRLMRAMMGIDTVIHAAALKQVPAAEYNPFECIKTNVHGAMNVIDCAIDRGVARVVALSTDKAAMPINLYGASKLLSDKLFVAGQNYVGALPTRFAVVRYGNVMGSRGSVIPFFLSRRDSGTLPITDPAMTRFNISLEDGVNMVLWSIGNATGGEILVPKIPSYRILDVATAVAPDAAIDHVGIRPGEKIHEEMITSSDSLNTVDLGDYYAILPPGDPERVRAYCEVRGGTSVPNGFSYNSGDNPHFLTVDELRTLIDRHVKSG